MRAFVVLGFVFCFPIPSQEISLGNVSKITCFVSSGMQNLNSANYLLLPTVLVQVQHSVGAGFVSTCCDNVTGGLYSYFDVIRSIWKTQAKVREVDVDLTVGTLENMIEPSMSGDDAAFFSNYFDHLFLNSDKNF